MEVNTVVDAPLLLAEIKAAADMMSTESMPAAPIPVLACTREWNGMEWNGMKRGGGNRQASPLLEHTTTTTTTRRDCHLLLCGFLGRGSFRRLGSLCRPRSLCHPLGLIRSLWRRRGRWAGGGGESREGQPKPNLLLCLRNERSATTLRRNWVYYLTSKKQRRQAWLVTPCRGHLRLRFEPS